MPPESFGFAPLPAGGERTLILYRQVSGGWLVSGKFHEVPVMSLCKPSEVSANFRVNHLSYLVTAFNLV
jgi:hypothetical protein